MGLGQSPRTVSYLKVMVYDSQEERAELLAGRAYELAGPPTDHRYLSFASRWGNAPLGPAEKIFRDWEAYADELVQLAGDDRWGLWRARRLLDAEFPHDQAWWHGRRLLIQAFFAFDS